MTPGKLEENGHFGPKCGPKPCILRGFQGMAPEKPRGNGHFGPKCGPAPCIFKRLRGSAPHTPTENGHFGHKSGPTHPAVYRAILAPDLAKTLYFTGFSGHDPWKPR